MTEIHQHKDSSLLETDLIIAAAHGDVEAFAKLVRKYTNAVCAIAYDTILRKISRKNSRSFGFSEERSKIMKKKIVLTETRYCGSASRIAFL